MSFPELNRAMVPRQFEFDMPVSRALIEEAQHELHVAAMQDADGCMGYFPSLDGQPGITSEFPANQELRDAMPRFELSDHRMDFSFTRLAVRFQPNQAPFHLDADSKAALLTTTADELPENKVWRLLVNLGSMPRTFEYADVDPMDVPIRRTAGYIHTRADVSGQAKEIVLEPRKGRTVDSVLFCSSRVLHAGRDDRYGHFVLAYGAEEPA